MQVFFYMYKYVIETTKVYNKMDDFEIKEKFSCNFKKIFFHNLLFQNILSILLYFEKNSAKNVFFLRAPEVLAIDKLN